MRSMVEGPPPFSQAYCENDGWQQWENGALAGTTGESLRLEAVQIALAYI